MARDSVANWENFIREEVANGTYQSREDILDEALRLLRNQHALRAEIRKGLAELDNGKGIPAKDVFAELRTRLEQQDHP